MRANLLTLVCLLCLSACEPGKDITDEGSTNAGDLSWPASPDQGVPSVKCVAAKGLTGDNLLCVDFANTQVTLADLMSKGWNFQTAAPCPGWTIANSKLQVTNFSTFMGNFGLTMPALKASEYQKYNSFTLSVVQTLDINTTKQGAYIYLGLDVIPQQIWYTTGSYAKTVTTLQIAKSDLPNGGSGAYQPFFKVTSSAAGGGFMGWQIESIAVNGNP